MFPYNADIPSPNPSWNNGMMYYQSNLNPYDSESFLNTVFNFNQQSIAAFQTLSHELKLKFYLSVEQMKLLGHMNDRQGYQNILQQIARRRMIIKKPDVKKENQKNQTQQWGAKLQNLCDDHLKKMQKDNFLDDLPINYVLHRDTSAKKIDFISNQNDFFSGIGNTQKNEQQFDWVQATESQSKAEDNFKISSEGINHMYLNKQQNEKAQQIQQIQLNTAINKKIEIKQDEEQFDDFVDASMEQVQKSQSLPIYSNYVQQPARGVGLMSHNSLNQAQQLQPKQQHIDIWDLEVIEDDPDKLKKIILNKGSSISENKGNTQNSQKQSLNNISEVPYQPSLQQSIHRKSQQQLEQQNRNQANDLYPVASSHVIGTNSVVFANNKQLEFYFVNIQAPVPTSQILYDKGSHVKAGQHQNSMPIELVVKEGEDEFEWEQNGKIDESETANANHVLDKESNKEHNNQFKSEQFINGNQFDFLHVSQQQYPNLFYSDKTYESKQVSQNTSNQQRHQNLSSPLMETSFGIDLKSFDNGYSLGDLTQQMQIDIGFDKLPPNMEYFKKKQGPYETENQTEIQSSMLASSLLPSVDTNILDPLKRFPPTENIVSSLRKKGFDFDRHFYKEALQLISTLGYQNNPDYQYIREQGQTCQQIFRLTQAYTAAVDQDKENEVKENLRKCKDLYSKLDTSKTVSTIKKYLKMEGRSLSYQIGRLSLEAGVPKQLIAKVVHDPAFNEIATLFYLMVFFGSIYSTSTIACQVIDYMEPIYYEMQKLGTDISQMPSACKKIIKQNQTFAMYKQNLAEISTLIRRFVFLGILSSKDELYYDMPTIQQKIDSLPHEKKQQKQAELVPTYFITFFAELASSNCSNIYTLHSQMAEFIDEHPLCALCVKSLESDRHDQCGGAKRDDGKFYHFKCWNFKNEVLKFKNRQMNQSNVQNVQ